MADENNIEQKIKLTYETNADKTAKTVDNLDKSIDKTVKTQEKSKKASKGMTEGLDSLGGGIGSTITGFKGLIKQMWLLVANPIGAVIAAIALALGGLVKAFTSTKAGGEQVEQIMDGIGAAIDVVRDRVLKIGGAILKFFKGDWKGAVQDARDAVSGMGDEIAEEFRKAAEARKSLQEVADTMRELGVARAKLNRDLVNAREIIESDTASYEEKKKAIEEVTKAEEEQTAKELENAQKKLDAIRAQNALSDSSSEALQAEADAEAALYEIQEKSAKDRIKNILLIKKAENEEKARRKALNDEYKKQAAERAKLQEEELKRLQEIKNKQLSEEEKALRALQDLNDKTEEEKLARQKERDLENIERLRQQGVDVRNLLIYNDELYATLEQELAEKREKERAERDEKAKKEQLERDKKQAEEEKKIEEAKLAQKKAIEEAKFGLLNQGIALAKQIFTKNKKVQKGILIAENAAALAKITMNTVEAVSKDNAASPLTLGMPWSGIHLAQGALGAANVIASTARGLKELGGGSAGSADNLGAARGGGASAAPQTGFQASSENQIATTIAQNTNEQPPVQAYVVESEVTNAQALARKKIDDNSFG